MYVMYVMGVSPQISFQTRQHAVCVLQKEHNELKKIIYVLQEFVTSNVEVFSPNFLTYF